MIDLARVEPGWPAEPPSRITQDGATLAAFADEMFDFVYSYAVFQHIRAAK